MTIIGNVDYFTFLRSREKKNFSGLENQMVDSTQIQLFYEGFEFGAKTSVPLFFSVFVVGFVATIISKFFRL